MKAEKNLIVPSARLQRLLSQRDKLNAMYHYSYWIALAVGDYSLLDAIKDDRKRFRLMFGAFILLAVPFIGFALELLKKDWKAKFGQKS
jgi:hypothetical protein